MDTQSIRRRRGSKGRRGRRGREEGEGRGVMGCMGVRKWRGGREGGVQEGGVRGRGKGEGSEYLLTRGGRLLILSFIHRSHLCQSHLVHHQMMGV